MPRKPPEGRRFKKGEINNPTGNNGSAELRILRRMSRGEIADFGAMLVEMKMKDFRLIPKDEDASPLKVMVAGMAAAAMKGNSGCWDKLLDRLVGKTKDRIEISGSLAVQRMTSLSEAEIKAKLKEQEAELKRLLSDK